MRATFNVVRRLTSLTKQLGEIETISFINNHHYKEHPSAVDTPCIIGANVESCKLVPQGCHHSNECFGYFNPPVLPLNY